MIKVFVDESGNMGVSGKYFVLAAVVVKTKKAEDRLKRLVRKEQRLDGTGNLRTEIMPELKFSKMKFTQRQRVIHEISQIPEVDVFYFVAYKPMIALIQKGNNKNLVYNYFSKLLMGKIFKRYKDDFLICFDQRTTAVKSMNSLTEYIQIAAFSEFPNLTGKSVIVNQADSRTSYLLQIADSIAGAAAQAYDRKKPHFLELLGVRIKVLDEFPKRGFVGSLKFKIGKLKLIDKLRGF